MTIYDQIKYMDQVRTKILIEIFNELPEKEQRKILNEFLGKLIDKIAKVIVKEKENDS